jgi:hypothetical protein
MERALGSVAAGYLLWLVRSGDAAKTRNVEIQDLTALPDPMPARQTIN